LEWAVYSDPKRLAQPDPANDVDQGKQQCHLEKTAQPGCFDAAPRDDASGQFSLLGGAENGARPEGCQGLFPPDFLESGVPGGALKKSGILIALENAALSFH
jgi:hypothetical protein